VREWVSPHLELEESCYWISDDTGFPKKGKHSVGVGRQYCGQLGKQENCQVAVTLSLASERGSLPIAYRLYLPEDWANDAVRREKAYVPADVEFKTKPQISLEQIRAAKAAGVPVGVVLADSGYGNSTEYRDGISELGLKYCLGVQPSTTVLTEDKRLRRASGGEPISVIEVASSLPERAWHNVGWRQGTNGPLISRFCALRVRAAHEDRKRRKPRDEEWLLIEWPEGAAEPEHYWLCTLAANTALRELVNTAMSRWRIERDYQELKQEFGLADYEGRGWRGFHHHATLCIAAYGYLVSQRLQGRSDKKNNRPEGPTIPDGYTPRGSRQNTTSCSGFDPDAPASAGE
jgi:SRSO17 transposase